MGETEQPINLHECREDCETITGGYTFEIILGLTGIYGIHPDFDFSNCTADSYIRYDKDDRTIAVSIETEKLETFEIVMDLKEDDKKISINYVEIYENHRGNSAFKMISSMVTYAIDCGFKLIYLYAIDDGRIVWPLTGFTPLEGDIKTVANTLILEYNAIEQLEDKKITSLYEFLHTANGRKTWSDTGHTYTGMFWLTENSDNINTLRKEVIRQNEKQVLQRQETMF